MKKIRSFKCQDCETQFERMVEDSVTIVKCECKGEAKRMLSAPNALITQQVEALHLAIGVNMLKLKVKMIDGVWVTAREFNGDYTTTNLGDFYLQNINGEAEYRKNPSLMLRMVNENKSLTEAIKWYYIYNDCLNAWNN